MSRPTKRYREEDRGYETLCWIWQLRVHRSGYGVAKRGRKPIGAHVAMWEDLNGPIPPGLQIDHLCRVRSCVNPAHLEAVTPAENTRRGRSAKLTLAEAREIRRLAAEGVRTRDLACRFNVAKQTVSNIKNGHTWVGEAHHHPRPILPPDTASVSL